MQAASKLSALARGSIVLLASSLAWASGPEQASSGAASQDAQKVIQEWPDSSKKAAKNMLEKYGEPDGVTDSHLIWRDNGPWVRTIVHKQEVQHDFPKPHKDVLEQFINYEVPEEKFSELAKYDGSVVAYRTNGELSARCDREAANFLALNLANDIIEGRRSVDEAREFYADAIQQLMQGNQPEYVRSLQFDTRMASATADPDERVIPPSEQAVASAQDRPEASTRDTSEATASTEAGDGEQVISSARLEGTTVVSANGEAVGEVTEVIENGDRVRIGLNEGFMGIGETEIILRVSDLARMPDGTIRTDLTREEIDSLKEPVHELGGDTDVEPDTGAQGQ